MFRSLMTIIRELYLYQTKVTFMLKHSVKLRRYMCLVMSCVYYCSCLVCIVVILCVFAVLCVYWCFYFRCRTAG